MLGFRKIFCGFVIALSFGLMGQAKGCPDLAQLMPKLDTLFGSSSSTKVYISNLSFMDAETKSVMPAGDAELINQAVEEGMKALAQQDPKYVVNDPQRTLANNDANAQKLNEIFWNATMTKTEKIDRIISELMGPAQIDGLVAGQFQQQKDPTGLIMTVRPFVIAKQSKNMMTETKKFSEQEFNCTDPQNQNRKVICEKTREEIKDVVIRLLKNL